MATFETITQFSKMLTNLDQWLEASAAYATQRGFDVEVLAGARLAPDQYELIRQIQSACDAAKFAAAYLSGQTAPSHPDVEKTIPELRQRLQTCIAYLATFKAADFAGSGERTVSPPWMGGNSVRGERYENRIAVPNFYFHVTTAYAILRHNGVPLGKGDYIGVKGWAELDE